ncbi:MAG: hypothetical protein D6677_05980 [Calditrichaeota bacterium]|nr:MAG: hypothetical protein D6677_05980 [Calditrichota bacterium]
MHAFHFGCRRLILSALLLWAGRLAADVPDTYLYRITYRPAATRLTVQLVLPERFYLHFFLGDEKGRAALSDPVIRPRNGRSWQPVLSGASMNLRPAEAGDTLVYTYDIQTALDSDARYRDGVYYLPLEQILWRPAQTDSTEDILLDVRVPANIGVSLPGTPLDGHRYRLKRMPYDWPALMVLGAVCKNTFRVASTRFHICVPVTLSPQKTDSLLHWLTYNAKSVAAIYGALPDPDVQIVLQPRTAREPVPFAFVLRGGGPLVLFYIDPAYPMQAFMADWTAVHEMTHLLMPYIHRRAAWLSEGMATYYQYILMARDGRLDEQTAWQKIYDGFQKGIRNARQRPLAYLADNMNRLRAFRAVYWSGAALMLRADVAWRRADPASRGLDDFLAALRPLTRRQQRVYGPEDVTLRAPVSLSDLYAQYAGSDSFPVTEQWLARLGVLVRNGRVILNDEAPLAGLRRAIMKTRP